MGNYSTHDFNFTDTDCLIIAGALRNYADAKRFHPIDRSIAIDIINRIQETVRKDKEAQENDKPEESDDDNGSRKDQTEEAKSRTEY